MPFSCLASVINWVVVDYPPYYILQGEYSGKGRDESVINLITPLLSQYQVKRHEMPASRAVKSLAKKDEAFCMVSLYKTEERERFITFSNAYSTLGLSPAIAMRKTQAKKLNLDLSKPVSLSELMLLHGLTLGVTLNRAYGRAIDEVIDMVPSHQVTVRAGRDTLESLTYMVQKKRIDLILGYPSEHHYLKSLMDKNNELVQLTIAEASDVVKGYIGCSKNPAGEQALGSIEAVLQQVNKSTPFNEVMLRWLPANMHPVLTPYLYHSQIVKSD